MTTTALSEKKTGKFEDLSVWWLILAIFAAATLLLPTRPASAQETAGPLPAAAPSDQPPPSPRASAPATIGGKPNLSGTWALNKDESDDPREAMQDAGSSGGHRGGGHVGVGGGMGGGGMGGGGVWGGGGQRGSGGAGGRGGRRGGQGDSGNAMNNLSQLTIEQTASSAKVTGESGEVLALYSAAESSKPNPSSASSSSPSSGSSSASSDGGSSAPGGSSGDSASASPSAQWQGTQLVAVTPGRREGSKTTRTYELSPAGKQLYVTMKMENPRFKKPVTFRLVYDPAPSGA